PTLLINAAGTLAACLHNGWSRPEAERVATDPVPTLTSRSLSAPRDHSSRYSGRVAISASCNAGLFSVVVAPSLKVYVVPSPSVTRSLEKYVGAAVLARTNCHSGSALFESAAVGLLNL